MIQEPTAIADVFSAVLARDVREAPAPASNVDGLLGVLGRTPRTRQESLDQLGWPRRALEVAERADTTNSAIAKLAGWDFERRNVAVLSGPRGTGKTAGAAWWALGRKERIRFGRAATFARTSRYDAEQASLWYDQPGLCLDDLGAEFLDSKGSFIVDFDELIDTYYADKRPLVITTNLTQDEFKSRYGGRVEDRIRECARWFVVGGESMRRGA